MSTPCNKECTPSDVRSMKETRVIYERQVRKIENNLQAINYIRVTTEQNAIEAAIEKDEADKRARDTARAETRAKMTMQERTDQNRYEGEKSPWQGSIGEHAVTELAREKLHLHDTGFTPQLRGIDNILKDDAGNYWVIEAKFTEEVDGRKSLEETKKKESNGSPVVQASISWTKEKIDHLIDRGKVYGNGDNSEGIANLTNGMIAEEIRKVGVNNVQRAVIHINPQTLIATAFKPDSKGDWKPFGRWEWGPLKK